MSAEMELVEQAVLLSLPIHVSDHSEILLARVDDGKWVEIDDEASLRSLATSAGVAIRTRYC